MQNLWRQKACVFGAVSSDLGSEVMSWGDKMAAEWGGSWDGACSMCCNYKHDKMLFLYVCVCLNRWVCHDFPELKLAVENHILNDFDPLRYEVTPEIASFHIPLLIGPIMC